LSTNGPSGPKSPPPKEPAAEEGRVYFKLGDLAEKLGVEKHVLGYWKKEFPQIVPIKVNGKRNIYSVEHLKIFAEIKRLLYEERFTVAGARAKLGAPPLSTVSLSARGEGESNKADNGEKFEISYDQPLSKKIEGSKGTNKKPVAAPSLGPAPVHANDSSLKAPPEDSQANQPSLFGSLTKDSKAAKEAREGSISNLESLSAVAAAANQMVKPTPTDAASSEHSKTEVALKSLLDEVKTDLRALKEMLSKPLEVQKGQVKPTSNKSGLH
jgi:DNA-binding transcriptional MerR regulator